MSSNFHHLARGIIMNGDKVLLAHVIGLKNTFLPGGHIEFGESAPAALKREIEEEIGLSCYIEGFLGLIEHKWMKNNEMHCEVNQVFKVNLPDLGVTKNPISCESHIEFIWVPVNELDKHHLQPHPFRELIPQLASGIESIWWESTLNIEIDADNIG